MMKNLTKQQIEKKYNIKLSREWNQYTRNYFWSVKDMDEKEIYRLKTLAQCEEVLREREI